jgi:hypothetical protein
MKRAPLLFFGMLLLVASAAYGYVRSRTDKGVAVFWPGSCVWIEPDSRGSIDLPIDIVQQVLTKSVANWQGVTFDAGCSYLKLNIDSPVQLEATLDHINAVRFRNDKWCRPADSGAAEMCFSPAAAAITTVFYNADGTIVDADIELNELNFTFVWLPSTVTPRSGTQEADLENTLTHELGHLQGLDHTCWDHVNATDPVDDKGQPIPDCDDVTAMKVPPAQYQQIVQSTMYNFANPGEIIKRMPKADDIAGICGIYPKSNDPMSCNRPPPVGTGCSVGYSRRPVGAGMALLALALMALACSRIRRR